MSSDPFIDFMHNLIMHGIENTVSRRFYSKYMGEVTSATDPSEEGRIQILFELIGDTQPYSIWAYPSSPYAGKDHGFYTPPHVGDMVWVWFDHGDLDHPHYSGGFWCNPDRNQDDDKKPNTSYVPEEFKSGGTPTTRGIKTDKVLMLFEDDKDRDPRFEVSTITPKNEGEEATKNHTLVMSEDASDPKIKVTSKKGHEILISDKLDQISLKTEKGMTATIDELTSTITLKTLTQSIVISDTTGTVTVTATGAVNIAAPTTNIVSPAVNVTGTLVAASAGVNPVKMTGQGSMITDFDGDEVSTFRGTQTKNITGKATWAIQGALTIGVSGAMSILGAGTVFVGVAAAFLGGLTLGSLLATKYRLLDERFLLFFNTHTHAGPGAPPTAKLLPLPVSAPDIDEKTVLTFDTKAS